MPTKRGRPGIKPIIKRLIYAKALENRDIPRLALAVELKNLIEEMYEVPPTEETMIKLISKARNHPASPLDEPWSPGSLAKYEMSPEALPAVMWVYEKHLREEEQPLTIRQAMWIARLYKVVDVSNHLEDLAILYANREHFGELLGNPTSIIDPELDSLLIRFSHPVPSWGKVTNLDKIKRNKEADNERPHNQAVQE